MCRKEFMRSGKKALYIYNIKDNSWPANIF